MKLTLKRLLPFVLIVVLIGRILQSCAGDRMDPRVTSVQLRWFKSYPAEEWSKVRAGLLWSLSLMGAQLDPATTDSVFIQLDSNTFRFDLLKAGFSERALHSLDVILKRIISSDEYQKTKAFDLGRFLVLTEHSSWHYYEIVDAPLTISDFRKLHPFDSAVEFRLHRSCVTKNARTIRFGRQHSWNEIAFIAEEHATKDDNSAIMAYEAFDVMANGQLRFMVYGADGKLVAGSTEENGPGKPTKCSWCHESQVQPLYFITDSAATGIGSYAFGKCVKHAEQLLDTFRSTLHISIDYKDKHAHEMAEYLYVGFMEPTMMRVMNEWNMDSTSVRSVMKNVRMHPDGEYKLFPQQWYRFYVDSLGGKKPLTVPHSAREVYQGEPDYFR